jgi:hypothetical protein
VINESVLGESVLSEEPETPVDEAPKDDDEEGQMSPTVDVVISPPSPMGSKAKPIELDDD